MGLWLRPHVRFRQRHAYPVFGQRTEGGKGGRQLRHGAVAAAARAVPPAACTALRSGPSALMSTLRLRLYMRLYIVLPTRPHVRPLHAFSCWPWLVPAMPNLWGVHHFVRHLVHHLVHHPVHHPVHLLLHLLLHHPVHHPVHRPVPVRRRCATS
eukprot:359734-Chlamydomonas_euryale.AAC.2